MTSKKKGPIKVSSIASPAKQKLKEEDKQMFKQLSGVASKEVCEATIESTSAAFPRNISKDEAVSVTCQTLKELAPSDPIEGMLCSQIIALNAQGMRYLARAESDGNWLCHTEAAVNMAIKLLRLKNETMETLMRHRRKGEQKVVVQHINVTDDARAIIGDLNDNRGGGNAKS